MAGSGEYVPVWPPSASIEGSGLHSLVSNRQQTNSGVEERMPEPSQRKGKRRQAHAGDKAAEDKRTRSPNWGDQEKTSLLVGKLEFFQSCMLQSVGVSTFNFDKSWSHYVADRIIDRCQKSCQGQWDTLFKDYKAVCDHEEKNRLDPSSRVSFWTMTKEQKDTANQERRSALPKGLRELPREFPRAWCKLIELISQIQDALSKLRVAGKKCQISIPVDPCVPSSSAAPVVASTYKDSASDIPAGIPGSQRAEDKLVLGMGVQELISSVIVSSVTKQMADTFERLKFHLEGYVRDLMQQLNTRSSGVLDLGNVDELAYPGAGVTLNCERSLSQDAQLNVANSSNPSSRDLFLDQSNATLWQSMIYFDPEAETVVYNSEVDATARSLPVYNDQQYASLHDPASGVIQDGHLNAGSGFYESGAQLQASLTFPLVQTDSADAGQNAVNQIQAPNEVFTLSGEC